MSEKRPARAAEGDTVRAGAPGAAVPGSGPRREGRRVVMVRLTPVQRSQAEQALRDHLGAELTVRGKPIRTFSTASLTLIDAVRLGRRGYSMAMTPETAERVGATLAAHGCELADLFRTGRVPARRAGNGTWMPEPGTTGQGA